MSSHDQTFSNEENDGISPNSAGEGIPLKIPQQLEEVWDLAKSITSLLEDCSIEFKAMVSKKQWQIVDSKSIPQTSWQTSVVTRTYFFEKDLDEAFQNLLSFAKIFNDNLSSFLALLQDRDLLVMKESQLESQNVNPMQIIEPPTTNTVKFQEPIVVEKQDVGIKSPKEFIVNVQRSFGDLLKAKINFDTKFTGFNAVLNKKSCCSVDPAECHCQICSNVLETISEDKTVNLTTQKRRKRIIKSKRLAQAKRTGKKGEKTALAKRNYELRSQDSKNKF